jgi:hypothetical protein
MRRQFLLIPICLFTIIPVAHSQKISLEIGGKIINELSDGNRYGPGAGLQAVYKITKHSGIETGLYYKVNPQFYMVSYSLNNSTVRRYDQKVINLPLSYRFGSRLVNFTAGFAVEYSLNLKQIKRSHPATYNDEFLRRLTAVPTLSISKSFYFSRNWVIEPELRTSAPIPQGGVGKGINISIRKKIF